VRSRSLLAVLLMAPGLVPGVALAQTALENGTPVTITDSIGDVQTFSLEVPPNMSSVSFTLIMGSGGGDPDINVFYESEVDPRCTSDNVHDIDEFCEILNPQPGTWFVEVRANLAYTNVRLVGLAAVALTDEVAKTISGGLDSADWYYIDVPVGQNRLTVTTSGGSGGTDNPDLAVGDDLFGSPQCTSDNAGTTEQCQGNNIASGRWYVLVVGTEAYSAVSLLADYEVVNGMAAGSSGAFEPGVLAVLLVAFVAGVATRRRRKRGPA
jgi:vibriolysin